MYRLPIDIISIDISTLQDSLNIFNLIKIFNFRKLPLYPDILEDLVA